MKVISNYQITITKYQIMRCLKVKKGIFLLGLLALILLLAACESASETVSSDVENSESLSSEISGVAEDVTQLNDEYAGALSVQNQLALGTLQLEDSDLAVDEALAGELLPLWQAVQSLSNSETAAEAEIRAVINQIQDTMMPEQITAIASMELTEESMTALIEKGGMTFGPGSGRGFAGGEADGEGAGSGFTGGGPGGGFFGGPPGGRPPGGGDFPGDGFGNLSEDEIATRQAQFAEGGVAAFADRALTGAVIRMLEVKTGKLDESDLQVLAGSFNPFGVVSEFTGIPVATLREEMAGGATLGEIITANGGDLEAEKNRIGRSL